MDICTWVHRCMVTGTCATSPFAVLSIPTCPSDLFCWSCFVCRSCRKSGLAFGTAVVDNDVYHLAGLRSIGTHASGVSPQAMSSFSEPEISNAQTVSEPTEGAHYTHRGTQKKFAGTTDKKLYTQIIFLSQTVCCSFLPNSLQELG